MSEGRVRVNGRVVTEPGTTVNPSRDQVEVDGVTVEHDGALLYLMLFKPPGVITSLSDPEGRPIITDLLPEQARRAWPVGRLDWDSEGLLIVTNDGRLTWLLTHPSREMDKTYHVKVRGMIPRQDAGLRHMRRGGIALPDGHVTDPTEVAHLGDTGRHTWFQIVLHEGRNREIRNMCEAVGYQVLRLRRVAIGPVELGELDTGMWRSMSASEVTSLYRAAGDEAPRDLTARLIELKAPTAPKFVSRDEDELPGPKGRKATRSPADDAENHENVREERVRAVERVGVKPGKGGMKKKEEPQKLPKAGPGGRFIFSFDERQPGPRPEPPQSPESVAPAFRKKPEGAAARTSEGAAARTSEGRGGGQARGSDRPAEAAPRVAPQARPSVAHVKDPSAWAAPGEGAPSFSSGGGRAPRPKGSGGERWAAARERFARDVLSKPDEPERDDPEDFEDEAPARPRQGGQGGPGGGPRGGQGGNQGGFGGPRGGGQGGFGGPRGGDGPRGGGQGGFGGPRGGDGPRGGGQGGFGGPRGGDGPRQGGFRGNDGGGRPDARGGFQGGGRGAPQGGGRGGFQGGGRDGFQGGGFQGGEERKGRTFPMPREVERGSDSQDFAPDRTGAGRQGGEGFQGGEGRPQGGGFQGGGRPQGGGFQGGGRPQGGGFRDGGRGQGGRDFGGRDGRNLSHRDRARAQEGEIGGNDRPASGRPVDDERETKRGSRDERRGGQGGPRQGGHGGQGGQGGHGGHGNHGGQGGHGNHGGQGGQRQGGHGGQGGPREERGASQGPRQGGPQERDGQRQGGQREERGQHGHGQHGHNQHGHNQHEGRPHAPRGFKGGRGRSKGPRR